MNACLLVHGFLFATALSSLPAFAAPALDDRQLTIRSSDDALQTRARLIRFIWGSDRLPAALPTRTSRSVASPVKDAPNLERVDGLEIAMECEQRTVTYHFIARTNNRRLVIVQQGHGCQLDYLGVGDLIRDLLRAGYSVLGGFMPRCRPEDCPGDCTAQHEAMFASLRPAAGSPLKFFLEPIAASLNYLQARHRPDDFPPYSEFHMAGLSGGGWTTTVYAAIDPRIRLSFPVAGTIPLYLRSAGSVGDIEQTLPEFYRMAGYPDLYVLGAFGTGRRQVQILNRRDDCCFGAAQHRSPVAYDDAMRGYAREVRDQLAPLGSGLFRLEIDETAASHLISRHASTNIILPELQRHRPTASSP